MKKYNSSNYIEVVGGKMFEEGGCEYYRNKNNEWEIWNIPMYGGELQYNGTYKTLEKAKSIGENFT